MMPCGWAGESSVTVVVFARLRWYSRTLVVSSGDGTGIIHGVPPHRAEGLSCAVSPERMVMKLDGPDQPLPVHASLTVFAAVRPQVTHRLGGLPVCPLPLCSISMTTPLRPGAVPLVTWVRCPEMSALLTVTPPTTETVTVMI